jgi:hypothetical protein
MNYRGLSPSSGGRQYSSKGSHISPVLSSGTQDLPAVWGIRPQPRDPPSSSSSSSRVSPNTSKQYDSLSSPREDADHPLTAKSLSRDAHPLYRGDDASLSPPPDLDPRPCLSVERTRIDDKKKSLKHPSAIHDPEKKLREMSSLAQLSSSPKRKKQREDDSDNLKKNVSSWFKKKSFVGTADEERRGDDPSPSEEKKPTGDTET